MTSLITFDELADALPPVSDIMDAMITAFVSYSTDKTWVAPVTHVVVEGSGAESPGGDACIKAGYVKGEASWVVKVAGGFPGNAALGLSNSQGVMLLFSQRTGQLECVLADNGHLTDVRTAAAAAACVREFKTRTARVVAVFGTGVIARLVVEYLTLLFPDEGSDLLVVSRSPANAQALCDLAGSRHQVASIESYPAIVSLHCNLSCRD